MVIITPFWNSLVS